ncbi:MAG TPA: twin-arginine translocase TatA/TatE family subunit [Pyrinomonadaceae bacterium]|nr:twin-arginine translocase TatA/TatE family subunit [Pyrinomonadaceae bacterium]
MNMFFLFNMSNPMLWVLIVAVIFLLFGGSKLPQLAKALGQSKKAFKDGLAEGEAAEDEPRRRDISGNQSASLSSVDDEALFEEARRRARLRVAEGDIPADRK